VAASLIVTIWATLTSDGGKIVDCGRWNFPWHNYMIGAIGNVVLLAVGLLFSRFLSEPTLSDKTLSLWGWYEKERNRFYSKSS
jgi:SSS family solute:Na+ symporter